MDQSEIDTLVHTVLQQMGYEAGSPASAAPAAAPAVNAASVASDDVLPDLGSDEFKYWIGVKDPKNMQVLKELRKSTQTRVCSGAKVPGQ